MKQYKIGGSKSHWWLSWTDGDDWKTTNFQYKGDLNRAAKVFKEQGYVLVKD